MLMTETELKILYMTCRRWRYATCVMVSQMNGFAASSE
jgi:hypothetical protein